MTGGDREGRRRRSGRLNAAHTLDESTRIDAKRDNGDARHAVAPDLTGSGRFASGCWTWRSGRTGLARAALRSFHRGGPSASSCVVWNIGGLPGLGRALDERGAGDD